MNIVTEENQKIVSNYIKEAAKATERVQEENLHLKDIYSVLKDEYEISPAIARKLVTARMKGEVDAVKRANDDFSDLNDIVKG